MTHGALFPEYSGIPRSAPPPTMSRSWSTAIDKSSDLMQIARCMPVSDPVGRAGRERTK
jgi:hypothetical protein